MVLESKLFPGVWGGHVPGGGSLAPEEVAGWEPVFEALVGQG